MTFFKLKIFEKLITVSVARFNFICFGFLQA
jgi:hypothetical protein